jgi:hypothetical protein
MDGASADDFVGAWRLVSYRVAAGEEIAGPMGPQPQGRLIYEEGGRMMVQVIDPRVTPFASGDQRVFTAVEGRAAIIGCIAYFGTYTVRRVEGIVVHHIEAASLPNGRGGDQVRYFELSGDRLTLKTPPILMGGRHTIGALIWERLPG